MPDAGVMDVGELIDGQKVRRSAIVFLVIATLAMLGDGFDLAAIGYVAPELIKHWHVAPPQLVPVFSAGLFGLLFGAPLLGTVGDRIGRKTAILIALCMYGGFSLLTMAAGSLNQFVVLRFLTGLGLGGMLPNVFALTAEVAPKRLRGMFIIIVQFGVPGGIMVSGLAAAALVPQYGWPVLLLVGGALPLLVAALTWFVLPESLKFLVQKGGRDNEVRRLARALRPDLAIDQRTRFTVAPSISTPRFGSPAKLFAGGLAIITPVLWIALAANQLTNFFILSWLPTLLQAAGLSIAQAGISASMFSTGGLVGGLLLIFIIDRVGAMPVVAFFIIGVPLIVAMGVPGLSPLLLMAIIGAAGFCVVGNNFGMNVVMSTIYPTPVRSLGVGWAQGFGRIGSLAAPAIGGILLGLHLPMDRLLLAPALALAVGAVASGILALLCVRQFGSTRLDELPAADTVTLRQAAMTAGSGHPGGS